VDIVLERIFRNPQYALSLAKKAVNSFQAANLTKGLKSEAEAFSCCFQQDYFAELMVKQIREGVLKTTSPLPGRFGNERE
jgi:enoyl-CoA hydratase/carnithine racemase